MTGHERAIGALPLDRVRLYSRFTSPLESHARCATGSTIIWTAFADLIFKYYKDLIEGVCKEILEKLYLANVEVYEAILAKNPKAIQLSMARHIEAESEILWPDQGVNSTRKAKIREA